MFALFLAAVLPVTAVPVGSGLDPAVRVGVFLNGLWDYIVDPQDMGGSGGGEFFRDVRPDGRELVQHDYDRAPKMRIPGDWNTADEKLFFYEGKVWFRKRFDYEPRPGRRTILRFGAASLRAEVWIDGVRLGSHAGGFTPFAFDVTGCLTGKTHHVIVCVDNVRHASGVPCLSFDWWNYGGLVRDVMLLDLPARYVAEGRFGCARGRTDLLVGRIRLSEPRAGVEASVSVPELGLVARATTDVSGVAEFRVSAKPDLWCPENPKLYRVTFAADGDAFTDEIGFRTVETRGRQILLNGKPVFLRGVCAHDEVPRGGRAHSAAQVSRTLAWAKELGCNFLRLAHYPHNEATLRELDRMGILAWSEIPVYWKIDWNDPATLADAENQLTEMIRRDGNRAAVIIWSIANETPLGDARNRFLAQLAGTARRLDDTRLVTTALLHGDLEKNVIRVEDPAAELVDIVSFNEYLGWYFSDFTTARRVRFDIPYDKPVIVSEFGGGGIAGRHGSADERWTEEFLAELYGANLEALSHIDGLVGLAPWILFDFRSPRRPCPGIQDYYNRKGLISEKGEKKSAFGVVRDFYSKWRNTK